MHENTLLQPRWFTRAVSTRRVTAECRKDNNKIWTLLVITIIIIIIEEVQQRAEEEKDYYHYCSDPDRTCTQAPGPLRLKPGRACVSREC